MYVYILYGYIYTYIYSFICLTSQYHKYALTHSLTCVTHDSFTFVTWQIQGEQN